MAGKHLKKLTKSFQRDFSEREFYSQTTGTERIAYINDNTDALLYRLNMFEQAEKEIILSTFDFNADKSGRDVMAALLHAADREIFVYETEDQKDSSLYQLRSYFEKIWELKNSREFTCKKLTGEIEECLISLKKRYADLKETYQEAYTDWDYQKLTFETNKISLLCNPLKAENKEPWMWHSIHQLLLDGKEALIYTPYIICGKEMYQGLTELKEKNIPLEIITNDVASGANPWGCTDYLNQRKKSGKHAQRSMNLWAVIPAIQKQF